MSGRYQRFAPLAPPRAQDRPWPSIVARTLASSPGAPRLERVIADATQWAPDERVVATHAAALRRLGLPGLTPSLVSTDAHATISVWLGLGLVVGTLFGGVAVAALHSHRNAPLPPKDITP